jgi:nucleoside-diphosphate-sugar epimerase
VKSRTPTPRSPIEHGTKPGHRRHSHRSAPAKRKGKPRSNRAENNSLQRHVINNVRALGAVEARDRGDRPHAAKQAVATASPRQGAQREPFGANQLAVVAYPGRDDHRKPSVARAARVIGKRDEQKNQSSVTRTRSLGGATWVDANKGRVAIASPLMQHRTIAEEINRGGAKNVARILVTGAAGFIGRPLCSALVSRDHEVIAGLRSATPIPAGLQPLVLGEIGPRNNWSTTLDGVNIVIHLAQRAHAGPDAAALATEPASVTNLARAMAAAGGRRLVLISSIKAMGEATSPNRPFRPDDTPRPEDAYGHAKLASERAAAIAARETGIELVIIRPPLVYGPGVRANFAALLRLAGSGVPLPFAGIDNRRSLIFRDNLVDLLSLAATHPEAAGMTLLVRDDEDFSTPALIRALAAGLGRKVRLFPAPGALFWPLRLLPGIGSKLARLTQSLAVDDSATRAALQWAPPVSAAAGLAATARAFAVGL